MRVGSVVGATAVVAITLVACTPQGSLSAGADATPTVSPAPSGSPTPEPTPVVMSTSTPVLLAPPSPTPTPTPTLTVTASPTETPPPPPPPLEHEAVVEPIPDQQWERMVSTGTWRPGCPVGREDLRRITLTFLNFDDQAERGVLVAHRDVVDDLIAIFAKLLDSGFQIERMRPVERYGGDVNTSLAANNTSAFNCRKPEQINAPVAQSPHANGRAIDINPVQNPWVDPRCRCWSPTDLYAEKTSGPGIIREGSPVIHLFEKRGWIWQDIDVPDYMHFDTGFPSLPRGP